MCVSLSVCVARCYTSGPFIYNLFNFRFLQIALPWLLGRRSGVCRCFWLHPHFRIDFSVGIPLGWNTHDCVINTPDSMMTGLLNCWTPEQSSRTVETALQWYSVGWGCKVPGGGSRPLAPVGRNPPLAHSIISLVCSSTLFPVSESSVDTHTGNGFPARVLAVYVHERHEYYQQSVPD